MIQFLGRGQGGEIPDLRCTGHADPSRSLALNLSQPEHSEGFGRIVRLGTTPQRKMTDPLPTQAKWVRPKSAALPLTWLHSLIGRALRYHDRQGRWIKNGQSPSLTGTARGGLLFPLRAAALKLNNSDNPALSTKQSTLNQFWLKGSKQTMEENEPFSQLRSWNGVLHRQSD